MIMIMKMIDKADRKVEKKWKIEQKEALISIYYLINSCLL